MFCPKCGAANADEGSFCPSCGAPLQRLDKAIACSIEGIAELPPEISGWNWGAFLLGWIWGIGNRVWIALLTLIPFVSLVMVFVLGVKGNEWAWTNKKWKGVEHFKRTQRSWALWGLGVWIAYSAVLVLIILLG